MLRLHQNSQPEHRLVRLARWKTQVLSWFTSDAHMSSLGPQASHSRSTHAQTNTRMHTLTRSPIHTHALKHSHLTNIRFIFLFSRGKPAKYPPPSEKVSWISNFGVSTSTSLSSTSYSKSIPISVFQLLFLFSFHEIVRLPPKVLIRFSKIGFNGEIFFYFNYFAAQKNIEKQLRHKMKYWWSIHKCPFFIT